MKKLISLLLTACIMIGMLGTTAFAAPPCNNATSLADALYEFGLFKGTGIDSNGMPVYSLDVAPTRQQAVVMLIRLLGKESDALACQAEQPFSDVDTWADRYIAYAYEQGLTKGGGGTTFGGNSNVNAQQYITFLLRALGYSDNEGDFTYDEALAFSDKIGMTEGKYSQDNTFLRRDIVWLSCGALLQPTKQGTPLVKQLKKSGVLTEEQYMNGLRSMMVADLQEDFRYDHFDGSAFDMYDLYTTYGSGAYAGYVRLSGYPRDDEYHIYYKDKTNIFVYHNIDTSKTVAWHYDGKTYYNTIAECYEFFSDTSKLRHIIGELGGSTQFMVDMFGSTYVNWVRHTTYGLKAVDVVSKYIDMQNGIYYYEPCAGLYPEQYFGLFNFEETWTEQELSADWINEWELQQLSGETDLSFGIMTSSLSDWSNGIGNLVYGFYLQGIASKELLYIYDMPESFANSGDAESQYSGISFKKSNGEWYFKPADLISIGLLNKDGSFNENFESQPYNAEKARKEWDDEWIDSTQLKVIYGYSTVWMGDEIWLTHSLNNVKYSITGVPSTKVENGVIYSGKCNEYTIRFQYIGGYDGGFSFNYDDLYLAQIVDK